MADMTGDPEFVVAEPAQAAAFARLHARCFARSWDAAAMRTFLSAPSCANVAAFHDGDLTGLVLARAAADEAEILTLAVAPHVRRRGIGEALMRAIEATLAGSGVRRLALEVGAGNRAARALYVKLGFERVGLRAGYYRQGTDGLGDDALLLVRILNASATVGGRPPSVPL